MANVVTLLVAALSLACAIIVLSKDIENRQKYVAQKFRRIPPDGSYCLISIFVIVYCGLSFATPFGIFSAWILKRYHSSRLSVDLSHCRSIIHLTAKIMRQC